MRRGDQFVLIHNIDVHRDLSFEHSLIMGEVDRVAAELGVKHATFEGAGRRSRQSSLNAEIRNAVLESSLVVILLGGTSEEELCDNWALHDFASVRATGIESLICVTGVTPEEILREAELPVEARRVSSVEEFVDWLNGELRARLEI